MLKRERRPFLSRWFPAVRPFHDHSDGLFDFLPRPVRHYLAEFEIDLDQLLTQARELRVKGTLTDLTRGDVNVQLGLDYGSS